MTGKLMECPSVLYDMFRCVGMVLKKLQTHTVPSEGRAHKTTF